MLAVCQVIAALKVNTHGARAQGGISKNIKMIELNGQDSQTLRQQIKKFIAAPKYDKRTRPREHRGPHRIVSGKRNLYQRISPFPRVTPFQIMDQMVDPWQSVHYKRNVNPILAPGNNQFDYKGVGNLEVAPNDPNPTGMIFNRFEGSPGMFDLPYAGAMATARASKASKKELKKMNRMLTSLSAQSKLSYHKSLVPTLHDPKELLKLREGGPLSLLRRADQNVRLKTGKVMEPHQDSLLAQQFKRTLPPGLDNLKGGYVKGQPTPRVNFSVDAAGKSIGLDVPAAQNSLLYSKVLSTLLKPSTTGTQCPAQDISESDPCNRSTGRKLHPDKNPGCPDLATTKFTAFTARCPNWLKTV